MKTAALIVLIALFFGLVFYQVVRDAKPKNWTQWLAAGALATIVVYGFISIFIWLSRL